MKIKKLYLLIALAFHVAIAQAQEKLVALSFDDGPNTTTTVHMLLKQALRLWNASSPLSECQQTSIPSSAKR